MGEAIEKVAQAICNAKNRRDRFNYDCCVAPECSCFEQRNNEARAVVEAIREPMKAWLAALPFQRSPLGIKSWPEDDLADAMIDALLAEKP